MPSIHRAFVALLAVAPLAAQATTTAAPAPHVLIETVGPDGWRMRYGPTNLGSLLESEQGRGMWQPQVLPLLGLWQQLAGDEAAFAAAKGRMLGYSGRVRLGIWLRAEKSGGPAMARVGLVLEGDGHTDMKALAADLRQLQKRAPGEWGAQELGDASVDVVKEGKDSMTAPMLLGGNLVMALASNAPLADAFAAARAMADGATGKPPAPTTPALRLDVDVAAILKMVGPATNKEDAAMQKGLGLDSLGRVQLTLGTAGPHVQVEVAQHFTPAPRGVFAALFPPVQGVPALMGALPKGEGSWRVGHFDFQALFAAVLEWGEDAGAFVSSEETRKKQWGIDPLKDLVPHMTSELLVLGAPLQALERAEDFTWVMALHLRDAKAFAPSLDTMLQHGKPELTREATVEIEGVECKRYGLVGYDLWFAVGLDTCFVAGGRDAEAQLTKVIAGVKAVASNPAAGKAPVPAFADLGKFLPPGNNALARGDVDSFFAVPIKWWFFLLSDLLPMSPADFTEDSEAKQRTRDLLQKHGLGTLRTATGYADSVWRWRLFW